MEKKSDLQEKVRNLNNLTVIILCLALLTVLIFIEIRLADTAYGAQTTGGVNWLDPLNYTKPAFYPITVPDEATCPNKYYVNMSGGSGSTCSQSSPCANLNAVAGKAGMSGGPAYIYLKGSGRLAITSSPFYGAVGSEIVIKPWPADSNIVTMTAGGSVSNANIIQMGTNIHHIVIDGGPDLVFRFVGSGSDQNVAYNLIINANYVTVARSRVECASGAGPAIGIATDYTSVNTIGAYVVNNEIFNCNSNGSGVSNNGLYLGGGTTCSGSATNSHNTYILNNIWRDISHRGIQIEPRGVSDNTHIEGNAFHNIGKTSCSGGWHCSPAISWADSCGGDLTNNYAINNLMWDIGASGIWSYAPSTANDNTIYDYGKGSDGLGGKQGISSYNSNGSGTMKNNIIYSPSGVAPFDNSNFTKSKNICSGCDIAWQSGVFLSTDPNDIKFLKIGRTSLAVDAGVNVGVTVDYNGLLRPYESGYDIGAFEYSPAPSPPTLQIQ